MPRKAPATSAQAIGAAKARAILAAKRAAGEVKPRVRIMPSPDETTFTGRIDLKLQQLGKTRREMEKALSVPFSAVARWARRGEVPRPERQAQIAEYLGVTVEWLRAGDTATALVPQQATVVKANGHHKPGLADRIAAGMQEHIDTTLAHNIGLLPIDLKVYLSARVAELLTMHLKKQ